MHPSPYPARFTSAHGRAQESTATIVSIIASALSILAAVFAYLVVDAIDKKQEDTVAKLTLREVPGPPPPPANLSMPYSKEEPSY